MADTTLVTGGSGFIGSYVVQRLVERGDRVVVFDIRPPAGEQKWMLSRCWGKFQIEEGSIDNWPALLQVFKRHAVTRVVHIAAIVNPVLLAKQPYLAMHVNAMGTFHVLEAARLFECRRVVYFSSIGVLPTVQYEPMDAKHPIFLPDQGPGATFYAAAKVASEAFCFAYQKSFGVDFITIRPSAVYGFGMQWPIYIKPMVENSVRAEPTRFDHGREFPRDYTHAADIAQLAERALDLPAAKVRDRIFYGATGRPLVTAGRVAECVKELIPRADIEIAAGLSEEDEIEIRYRGRLSIREAEEQLGYRPQFADIRDGVREYTETYRRYVHDTKA